MRENYSIWTPEQDTRLLSLRDEGLPTKEIAERMGVTKNRAVGRLHRLARLAEDDDDAPIVTMDDRLKATAKFPKSNRCVWPHGDPSAPEFHFCHAPVVIVGAPYCSEHLAVAWVKPKLKRI